MIGLPEESCVYQVGMDTGRNVQPGHPTARQIARIGGCIGRSACVYVFELRSALPRMPA
jgi:hypothetical protein